MIVKSKNSKVDPETAADRRKRRADRNRLRTIKHVHKLLDQIQEGISDGFNHLGWSNAAMALKQVSVFISPLEYTDIGSTWRNIYAVDDANSQFASSELEDIIRVIKKRIEGEDKNAKAEYDPWE